MLCADLLPHSFVIKVFRPRYREEDKSAMTRRNSSPSAILNARIDPRTGVEEMRALPGEKTALNLADIYRSTGWSGSDMWLRLPE